MTYKDLITVPKCSMLLLVNLRNMVMLKGKKIFKKENCKKNLNG